MCRDLLNSKMQDIALMGVSKNVIFNLSLKVTEATRTACVRCNDAPDSFTILDLTWRFCNRDILECSRRQKVDRSCRPRRDIENRCVPGLTCVRRPHIRSFSSIIQVVKQSDSRVQSYTRFVNVYDHGTTQNLLNLSRSLIVSRGKQYKGDKNVRISDK